MKKFALWGMNLTLMALVAGSAVGEDQPSLSEELGALKTRIEQLEQSSGQSAGAASSDAAAAGETPWYEKIDLAVGVTGILQGTPGLSRNDAPFATGNVIDGSMSLDVELTMPVSKSGKAFVLFEAGGGNGIDADIPTLSGFNDDADDDHTLRPTEVWYEHTFGEKVRLRGGKVDLTTDFDVSAVANSETDQFLSTGFVNNLAVEFPDDNGFGAMLWVAPNDLIDLGVGFADADADWDHVFQTPFTMVELGFKPKIAERQGNYRVYGWHNSKDHERLTDDTVTGDANYGFGFSADQEVAEGVTLFARYGHQRGSVSQIEHAWSTGLQISGQSFGRADDAIGFAYGQAVIGKDWKAVDLASFIDSGNEHHLEVYYKIKANEHLHFSPDLQWVKNPNGDKGNKSVWAFALRAQVSF
ncbi:MAG: carbohydrate porin [Acidobacteriota bacterium]|jgi:carbohydrate-selective porin OprB|nr:carbohydrate porin [Acidobacteriota bacterium]